MSRARKQGTSKWHVYTFIADRPFRSVKAKIRALPPRTSQWDLQALLIRINQITRGWYNYFKRAIAQRAFEHLHRFTWWRIARMMRTRHRWRWKDVRRWLTDPTGRWRSISADGIELFNPVVAAVRVDRTGRHHPNPLDPTRCLRHLNGYACGGCHLLLQGDSGGPTFISHTAPPT